ncbi:MAG: GNAT family N-acetyltransferase [Caulobacteraceae bacterium]
MKEELKIFSATDHAEQLFEAEFASRSDGAGLTVRPTRAEDDNFLYALFSTVQPMQNLLPESFSRLQFQSRNAAYGLHFPQATSLLVERSGTPIGTFIVDWTRPDCTWGVDLAVLPRERRGAAGWRLLCAWLAVSDRLGKPARLSVAPANPAKLIYQRLGFLELPGDDLPIAMQRPNRQTALDARRACEAFGRVSHQSP